MGRALNFGKDPDGIGHHPRDGIISAEEAFEWAKPLMHAENLLFWLSMWFSSFLIDFFVYMEKEENAAVASKLMDALINATLGTFLSFIFSEFETLVFFGHIWLNHPHISDRYRGELPIIERK